jgi:hypothetical protein
MYGKAAMKTTIQLLLASSIGAAAGLFPLELETGNEWVYRHAAAIRSHSGSRHRRRAGELDTAG